MQFNPAVCVIFGGFSLFFLISGIRALKRKRMTVVNPDADGAWPGKGGHLLRLLYEHTKPPEIRRLGGPEPEFHMEVTGADAAGMAWLYIVLGVLFLGVGVFDLLMRNDLLAFLFD